MQLGAYGDVASTAANAVLDVAGAKYGLSMDALDAALSKVAGGLDKLAARAGPFTAAGLKSYKGGFEKLAVSLALSYPEPWCTVMLGTRSPTAPRLVTPYV